MKERSHTSDFDESDDALTNELRGLFGRLMDFTTGIPRGSERAQEAVFFAGELWQKYQDGDVSLDEVRTQLSSLDQDDPVKGRVAKEEFFVRYHEQNKNPEQK